MMTAEARAWLANRKITRAEDFGVTSGDGGDWIVLPYLREGKIVNRKHRHIREKKHYQDAGGVKCVWNEDALRETEFVGPVIITEGEWDALSAIEAGYDRVVSVPDGAPNERGGDGAKYSFMPDLLDLLRGEDEIILAVDGDKNGENLLHDLAHRIGRARCKYVRYPKDCKDLNDALMKFGVKGVEETIKRAQHVKVDGLVKLSQLPPEPDPEVYRAGLTAALDTHLGFCLGHMSLVTGVPNMGKSTFLRAVIIELAKRYGWQVCVASFEDSPSDIRREFAKYLSDTPAAALGPAQYAKADQFLDEHFSFIIPDYDDEATLEWVIERMETAAIREGAKFFVVDPWSDLDHLYGQERETQYVSRAIATLKRFARRFRVHVCIVAHPKMMEVDRKGQVVVPTGYHVAGSAHWFNKPELGVTVHRETSKSGLEYCLIRIWKSKRHDVMGKPGDVQLHCEHTTGRYSNFFDPVEHGGKVQSAF